MLFSQHTPTECMIREACMLEIYFNDILFMIAYIIIVCCYYLKFVIFVHFCYCSCVHRVRSALLFCRASLELLFCLFYLVYLCFRTPTFLLFPCSYFPIVSCVPQVYFLVSSFFYSFLNISNCYFLVYFFLNISLCCHTDNFSVVPFF